MANVSRIGIGCVSSLLLGVALLLARYATPTAQATDFGQGMTVFTQFGSNGFSGSATNLVFATNSIEFPLYHTFQTTAASTAGVSILIERTLDSINWVPCKTNTFSTNGTVEFTMTGHWMAVRFTALTTNGTASVLYLGGR